MSDAFAADWLALREPVDHAARNAEVQEALESWAAGFDELSIVDLGAGRGSNLRYLAPRLHSRQHWRLVDHEPALLEEVAADATGDVTCEAQDLAATPLAAIIGEADLVTAAALFDLVGEAWLDGLIDAISERGAALLVTGTVDGRVAWTPELADDEWAARVFVAHQGGDKGFGPALGAGAAAALADRLEEAGFESVEGLGDWQLEPADGALQAAYLDGVVSALREARPDEAERIERWAGARHEAIARGRSTLMVGHQDIFAWPQAARR